MHDDTEAINAKYSEVCANLITSDSTNQKMNTEIKFLKEKLTVSKEKLAREIDANTNLFSTIRMTYNTLSQELRPGSTDEEKKFFLSAANFVELLNPFWRCCQGWYPSMDLKVLLLSKLKIHSPWSYKCVCTWTLGIISTSRNPRRSKRDRGLHHVVLHLLSMNRNLKIDS